LRSTNSIFVKTIVKFELRSEALTSPCLQDLKSWCRDFVFHVLVLGSSFSCSSPNGVALEFGLISNDDLLEIGSYLVEFHLCKVWVRFLLIWGSSSRICARLYFCS
jgi:hypothetical protein